MTCLGSWGRGARRASAPGAAEVGTVRHDDSVLSKADGYGMKGLLKGWASVIIPTSLAGGVEIADSVKFTTAVLFPCVVGNDAVWVGGCMILCVACPVCWGDGSHPVSKECVARRVVQGWLGWFVYLSSAAGLTCQVVISPCLLLTIPAKSLL